MEVRLQMCEPGVRVLVPTAKLHMLKPARSPHALVVRRNTGDRCILPGECPCCSRPISFWPSVVG